MSGQGCAGHGSLAEELRTYAGGALDALEPLVDRIRQQPPSAGPEPASCAACPVCALITVLRGGRSELAVRLADQVAELLGVLRTAMEEGMGADPAAPPAAAPPAAAPPAAGPDGQRGAQTVHQLHRPARSPRVQRIEVRRDSRHGAGTWLSEPC
jgi:hypothetical protein